MFAAVLLLGLSAAAPQPPQTAAPCACERAARPLLRAATAPARFELRLINHLRPAVVVSSVRDRRCG